MVQWIKLKHANGDSTFIKPYQLTRIRVIGEDIIVSYIDQAEIITEKVVNDLDELIYLDEEF